MSLFDEPWPWMVAGGVFLLGAGMNGSSARQNPKFPWSYPANAADKWQWFLDLTQLGFEGQGTVYISSWHGWDAENKCMLVKAKPPNTVTKKPIKYLIGFTCSRLTNLACGYQCNAGPQFHVNPAYNAEYQMTTSCYGAYRKRSGSTPILIRGYSEYATKIIEHTHKTSEVYGAFPQMGQINLFINYKAKSKWSLSKLALAWILI